MRSVLGESSGPLTIIPKKFFGAWAEAAAGTSARISSASGARRRTHPRLASGPRWTTNRRRSRAAPPRSWRTRPPSRSAGTPRTSSNGPRSRRCCIVLAYNPARARSMWAAGAGGRRCSSPRRASTRVGLDLVPANVEVARERAARWQSAARFEVADMDALPDGPPVDLVLVFDALHHTSAQRATLEGVFRRLQAGRLAGARRADVAAPHLARGTTRARRARLARARPHPARPEARPAQAPASTPSGASFSRRARTRAASAASPGS